ncbi:MAG: cyclase family protein [Planctomycetes bacterium]|nr:cyclase family protein [Planctomycetota bacterium]MCB9891246.1 cyclase family protein [Planctomycetota bacterium]MCB9919495.1 cyclase family protein [Planctomycetota bacterium]
MKRRRIWDISETLGPETATWPGDSPFTRDWIMRIDSGNSCNVSTVHTSVHNGTHGDAPMHFLDDGMSIDRVPLDAYLGRCIVVHVEPEGGFVPERVVRRLAGEERALFRTNASHDERRFDEEFCAFGEAAARTAVELGLRLVGLDTPSIDHFTSKEMTAHKVLLRGGIAILENLDLSAVPEGHYELIALPLKIAGSDASPIRAVLRELGDA